MCTHTHTHIQKHTSHTCNTHCTNTHIYTETHTYRNTHTGLSQITVLRNIDR